MKSRQEDEVLIMPVGDIQWSGDPSGVALGMLKRHIAWGVEKGAYFLGMGDYIDFASPSNRQRLLSAALYDTAQAVIDQKAEELAKEIYEVALKPSTGRWLGLLEGHHFHQYRSGETTDQQLARMLKTKFLGSSAYIRLLFKRGGPRGFASVLIWCHHGAGAGSTPAGVLNRLRTIATGFAGDVFLMGHLPRKTVDVLDSQEPVFPPGGKPPYLQHRTKVMAGTGGFMKAWVPQSTQAGIPRGGYAEQKMLPPAALGGILVKVRPRWKQVNGHDIWLPDINVEV